MRYLHILMHFISLSRPTNDIETQFLILSSDGRSAIVHVHVPYPGLILQCFHEVN